MLLGGLGVGTGDIALGTASEMLRTTTHNPHRRPDDNEASSDIDIAAPLAYSVSFGLIFSITKWRVHVLFSRIAFVFYITLS